MYHIWKENPTNNFAYLSTLVFWGLFQETSILIFIPYELVLPYYIEKIAVSGKHNSVSSVMLPTTIQWCFLRKWAFRITYLCRYTPHLLLCRFVEIYFIAKILFQVGVFSCYSCIFTYSVENFIIYDYWQAKKHWIYSLTNEKWFRGPISQSITGLYKK